MNGSDDGRSLQQEALLPRYTRRLSDKVIIAFHQACDQGEIEVARRLLTVLELMVQRQPIGFGGGERRLKETLVAAYERLWHLQHPEAR